MKKIRLTESDLVRIIEKVIKEDDFFYDDMEEVTPKGKHSKAEYKGGKVTRATRFPDSFMDDNDQEVDFNPEGRSSTIYNSLERFKEDHPDLYGAYFGEFGDGMFDAYGGEFEVFDDLAEMKRKVRVMENRLRRKRQMRRR